MLMPGAMIIWLDYLGGPSSGVIGDIFILGGPYRGSFGLVKLSGASLQFSYFLITTSAAPPNYPALSEKLLGLAAKHAAVVLRMSGVGTIIGEGSLVDLM